MILDLPKGWFFRDVERAHQQVEQWLAESGVMTPKQYRAAIERLGLSQEGAGVLFGVTKRTGQNWIANGPPAPVAILVRLMLAGKITETDVHNARKKSA